MCIGYFTILEALREKRTLPCSQFARQRPKFARQSPLGNVLHGNAIIAVRHAKTARQRLCHAPNPLPCTLRHCRATFLCRAPQFFAVQHPLPCACPLPCGAALPCAGTVPCELPLPCKPARQRFRCRAPLAWPHGKDPGQAKIWRLLCPSLINLWIFSMKC